MNKKNANILIISAVMCLAAIGVLYFLVFPKYQAIDQEIKQIDQLKSTIEAKKSYYTSIDTKIKELNDSNWSEKKKMIEINFTPQDPFFSAKMDAFFKALMAKTKMNLSGLTSSTSTPVKSTVQPKASSDSSGVKISGGGEPVVNTSSYLNQLQGAVKKTSYNLNVAGTYAAFKEMLAIFENQTRVMTVKSVNISTQGQVKTGSSISSVISATIAIDTYSY